MNKIIAIITVFYPTSQNTKSIEEIAKQVDELYICDNTMNSSNEHLFQNITNCIYVWFNKNLGLSKAFNYILENYTFNSNDLIVFFDQDSTIPEEYISKLESYYNTLREHYNIGCVGPVFFDENLNKCFLPKDAIIISDGVYDVKQLITSSLMIEYSTLQKIHFWNENIFLDFADFDLCWRLKAAGLKIFQVNLLMHHKISNGIKKIGFLKIQQYPVIRDIYQMQAAKSLLLKKYVPFRAVLRFLYILFIRPLVFLCFLDKKAERASAIYRTIIKNDIYR